MRPPFGALATPESTRALWRLLVVVLGDRAPGIDVVASWSGRNRALTRQWAERQLARYAIGPEGCPSLRVPAVLGVFVLANETRAA